MTDAAKLQAAAEELAAVLPDNNKVAAINSNDLCKTYQSLKPALKTALAVLENLPFPPVPVVVRAVRLLMTLADQLCPAA